MRELFVMGYRNIVLHKGRSIMTMLGLALGVALILAIQIAGDSLESSMSLQTSKMYGQTDIRIEVPADSQGVISSAGVDKLENTEGIQTVLASLKGYTRYKDAKGEAFLIQGVDIAKAQEINSYDLTEGQWLSSQPEAEGRYSILISNEFAKNKGLHVGDTLQLMKGEFVTPFVISGLTSGTGGGQSILRGGGLVTYATAQQVLGLKGANQLDIIVQDPGIKTELLDTVKSMFPALEVSDQDEAATAMKSGLTDMNSGLLFLTVISLFLGGFIIYNTFSVIVTQRTKEIGTLRALGARRNTILKLFFSEIIVLAFLGVLFGLTLGSGLGYAFLKLFAYSTGASEMVFEFSWVGMILSAIAGLLLTCTAAFIPVWRVSRCSPMEAFGQIHMNVDKPDSSLPLKSGITGMLLLVGGILIWSRTTGQGSQELSAVSLLIIIAGIVCVIPFVIRPLLLLITQLLNGIFGFRGRLAALNLQRSKQRTTTTVTMIIVSVTVIVSLNTLTHSIREGWMNLFREEIGFDLVVYSDDRQIPFGVGWDKRLQEVEGVSESTPFNIIFRQDAELHRQVRINGINMKEYYKMSPIVTPEGFDTTDTELIASGKTITISEKLAIDSNLVIGDHYVLNTANGKLELPIAGIYKEMDSGGYTVNVPIDIFDKSFQPVGRDGYYLKIDNNSDPEQVRQNIKNQPWGASTYISTVGDTLQQISGTLAQMFVPFDAISIISVIVAMLGVANTMIISVSERKREIGMLRAIGSDYLQIMNMILIEGLVLGLLGLLAGYPAGTFLGYLMVKWWEISVSSEVSYILPVGWLAIGVVVTLLLTTIAAIVPARKAARMDIVQSYIS